MKYNCEPIIGKQTWRKNRYYYWRRSGIGLATAKRFVSDGAYVFIIDRQKKKLDTAVSEIGKNAEGVEDDVSNPSDLDNLYMTVKDHKGQIDILLTNVDIIRFVPLEEITEEHFYNLIDVNVKRSIVYNAKSPSYF